MGDKASPYPCYSPVPLLHSILGVRSRAGLCCTNLGSLQPSSLLDPSAGGEKPTSALLLSWGAGVPLGGARKSVPTLNTSRHILRSAHLAATFSRAWYVFRLSWKFLARSCCWSFRALCRAESFQGDSAQTLNRAVYVASEGSRSRFFIC